MSDEARRFSRFQVRCEGRPAWAVDARARPYYFDGLRFWVLGAGRSRLTIAWQAPSRGWVHGDDCGCSLCADSRRGGLPRVA
jgi:hypothetical protein